MEWLRHNLKRALEPQRRNLTWAIIASLVIHAILLSIHFELPKRLEQTAERALDVILVNRKSAKRPSKAQALAQANLDGGGNTDENRRISTPLPPSLHTREGDSLVEARKRVTAMETQQQQLMTQLIADKSVKTSPAHAELSPRAPTPVSGLDLQSRALAIARLEGQISKNFEEYNQRPRRKFIGARVEEYRFAQYVDDWRQKVERIGNLNYPESAKGRLYGSLVLTVIIKSDGTLVAVDINLSSGHKVLDDAARRVVDMASPYAQFPEAIRRDTDIIEITRTWTFTRSDQIATQ